jgi:hypothetical protein
VYDELDAMHAFHAERGIQHHHGRGRREEGRDHIRWCFADAATADAFAAQFAGKRLIEPMPENNSVALIERAKRNIQKK